MLAFDTETDLIRPGCLTPEVICCSFARGQEAMVVNPDTGLDILEAALIDSEIVIGHNVAFDFAAIVAHPRTSQRHPRLPALIFEHYRKGLVRDTLIRELLILIRNGELKYRKKGQLTLRSLAKKYLLMDLDKTEDSWRLRYSELKGIPIGEWPPEAIKYSEEDAKATLGVFNTQEKSPDEKVQVAGAYALHYLAVRGIKTDVVAVDKLRAELQKAIIKSKEDLVASNILRYSGKKLAKDTKYIQALVEADLGSKVTKTKTGRVKINAKALKKTKNKNLHALVEYSETEKLLTTYVPLLEAGSGDIPIQASFNVLVDTGRTSCSAKGTLIRTRAGFKPIENVRVGDLVWTHKQRWRRVLAHWCNGTRNCFKISFSNGEVLVCTGNHRLLNTEGDWVFVEDLYDGLFKMVFTETKSEQCTKGLQIDESYYESEANRRVIENNRAQCLLGIKACYAEERASILEKDALFELENRQQKSNERKKGPPTPQLQGSVRRRVWISDLSTLWEARSCTPLGNGETAWYADDSGSHYSASYRRQQTEQHSGQSGFVHEPGTPSYSYATIDRSGVVQIEEIIPGGFCEVYDITVEEDESYETAGVFSHNCSAPNLQNQPRKPGVRECFVPRPGYVFAACDYDAAELRALAQVCYTWFNESKMRDVFIEGLCPHVELAAQIVDIPKEEARRLHKNKDKEFKEHRQFAKIPNFGFPGGLGAASFVKFAEGYGYELTEYRAKCLKDAWFLTWPEMHMYFERIKSMTDEFSSKRIIQLFSNRIRGNVSFTQAANSMFQGLVADGAKCALFDVTEECYVDKGTALFGCFPICFIHDEIIIEAPIDTAPEAASRLSVVMNKALQKWITDVPVTSEAHLMSRWQKDAGPQYDSNGRLKIWEDPKKGGVL